jgi:YidC/Oxa1 family membrane protein insertase
MNVKELLLVVGLALITTWTIDYFFLGKRTNTPEDGAVKSGQSFEAPLKQQTVKPLNTEVDFMDVKRSAPAVTTEVNACNARWTFNSDGACLDSYEFQRCIDGQYQTIATVFPGTDTERERRCFLVALEEETPYYYTLTEQSGVEGDSPRATLTYQADAKTCVITKTFTVHKALFKVDVALTITPKNGAAIQPRIIYAAPLMPYMADDSTSAVLSDEKGKVAIISRAKINPTTFWAFPTLFGAEDRYFVHAMVSDPAHFAQRGYYKALYAIIEGPSITEETSWTTSYYFGPKEEGPMAAVDPRLHDTLGYAGWFAPIAKWLLKLLNLLYRYLGDYGLAIIALTILTKIVLLPFSIKGAQSMKKHNEVQAKLKYLQHKYKDDIETLTRERAELMRKEGLSSMAGCLPILLQLPIFFALSRVLSTSIELYRAPFFCWITDLSARDPYYILPLLTALIMLVQAFTVDQKQRVQLIVMALIFGAITANLAAGLVLYIFMSTLLGVVQTIVQKRFNMA